MNMKRLIQIALAAWVIAAPLQATNVYTCNFEDSVARSRWTLNPAANASIASQLANKWYIGEPGDNSRNGHYGLYISNNGGTSASYTNRSCWVFAYDTLTLNPLASGDYTLVFDYCATGNMANGYDGLYAFWIPVNTPAGTAVKVMSNPFPSPTEQNPIPSLGEYVLRLQPTANMYQLNGVSTWRQCAVKIKSSDCDGTPHYLAFAWLNLSHMPQQPGAMVDNILVTDVSDCEQPTNLVINPSGTTVQLSWDGTATEYEVSAYSYDGDSWAGPKIVTGNQTAFSGLPMGWTDFIVRAKCDEDYYSLKTIESKLIYYPDQLCVDYLNLDNAKCYVSDQSASHPSTETFNDFILQSHAVDYGSSNVNSLHVVHFDRDELEPRTGNMAHTVPEGEFASVRLGNWDDKEFSERIEFTFDVDTIKYPVLLLKYMPILEAPTHEDDENPRFTLDILINGQSIGRCGMADFNANSVRGSNGQLTPAAIAQGWHSQPSESSYGADVYWKEWTTVGVNLRKPEYQGKQLTARLTTYDCVFNAHFGYAYFTLGCSDGKLKGMKCGEINPTFEAPDGFEYRWAYAYNEKYRNKITGAMPAKYVLGRGQTFDAGMHDDSLYVVDCMFVQDSTCFFSLYASTLATNPVAKMKKPRLIRSCSDSIYQVKFDASPSWVQEIDHVKGDTMVSKNYHIEHYEWNIEGLAGGWSDEVDPTFKFPLTGGDYVVKLTTTCGTCDDVLEYHLHLDPLGPTYETQTYTLCDDDRKGAGFEWKERNDTTYHTYGLVDSVVLTSQTTSCDSVIYLELNEPKRLFVDTVVFPESLPFVIGDYQYNASVLDTIPAWSLNCDLTYVLNLEVYESLLASMPSTQYRLCEGDPLLTLIYDITRGRSLRYSYTFDDPSLPSFPPTADRQKKGQYNIDIPLPVTLQPNVYSGSLLLEDSLPKCNVTIPFTLTVNYNSAVIAQRWNDVLAIRNADFNGGYQFDSVQWYVSGQPIEGATDFNYYTGGNGVTLRFGEEYTALLTRNDGVKLFTCPFIPTAVAADIMDMPSLVPPSAAVHVNGKGTASWYDMLGRLHHTDSYDHSDIVAPASAGYYLLVLQSAEARTIQPVMVK